MRNGLDACIKIFLFHLLAYIDTVHERHPDVTLSVVLPDYVIVHWWEYLLHNQTTFRLKVALRLRPGIVVIDVPEHLEHERRSAHGGQ